MKKLLLLLILAAGVPALQAQYTHHAIHAVINQSEGKISVIDSITFTADIAKQEKSYQFKLNKHLIVEKKAGSFNLEQLSINDEEGSTGYRADLPSDVKGEVTIPVKYSGRIHEEIKSGAAEYARGFSTTDGIISTDGVYLAGSSVWLPHFEGSDLFTFNLTIDLDEEWNVVTQGTRTMNELSDHKRRIHYDSPDPVDEVYLVAGPWTEYSVKDGDVLVQAFLRTPDEELANRYLDVTGYYLKLYDDLIGPYPYTKFALVENFWETGFGMPSFTLLGPQVIRFPWILHSSYPHELLHNYWGNSVYVDYSQGNWCEGITAYMADHLIKEQQGQGDEYRRTTLQKFTDYVNPDNDFPPSEFISRNNPAEEAIGYGKVMMFNNMLRVLFGDEAFRQAYADFYSHNRFRFASWDDIRTSFERVTGKDLKALFDQWIKRKGAPTLELSDVRVTRSNGGYDLSYTIRQVQDEAPFNLNIPVAVFFESANNVTVIPMTSRKLTFKQHYSSRPLKVSVDPQFNVMRRLHYSEVPSSMSQLFGAERSAIILPSDSEYREQYESLARFWQESQKVQGKELVILDDEAIDGIPSDMPVWVVGFENRFYNEIKMQERYRGNFSDEEDTTITQMINEQSLVCAIPNADAPGQTIGFIGTHFPEDIMVLARKLPHYGSYGYLGFTGSEFTNVLKGMLPVLNSAMDYVIPYDDHPKVTGHLQPREALSVNSKQ